MAKLVYGPDHGTISALDDGEQVPAGDTEVTADQALALATSQIATMLNDVVARLDEIALQLPGTKEATN